MYICSLGCILVRCMSSSFNQMDSPFKIQRLSMLSKKSHHSKTLASVSVTFDFGYAGD